MILQNTLLALRTQYLFLTFLGVPFSVLFNDFYNRNLEATEPKDLLEDGYDFVIVGAGSAGSVVAARLSEKYDVLLLEAGGYPFPLTFAPVLAPLMLRNPDIDWMDATMPQAKACNAWKYNMCLTSHGKGLGGSSMLNYMMYMRGNPNDYDRWANLTKDDGWSYENLLPYFRKMEDYHGRWPKGNVHGTGGPLHVETNTYFPLAYEMGEAAKELGLESKDPNGYQTEGVYQYDTTTKNGKRFSTFSAYIEPVLRNGRKTLNVESFAHVTKIELDENNHAVGVHFAQRGKSKYVKAKKEVIVSAGSLGSPKILMLSGIGPKESLEEAEVPVKIDLPPVGQNLKDHLCSPFGPVVLDLERGAAIDSNLEVETLRQYLETGKGRLSLFNMPSVAGFATSHASKSWPDVMVYPVLEEINSANTYIMERALEAKNGILESFRGKYNGNHTVSFYICPGLPRSSGQVKLISSDPFMPPFIDPKYLHDDQDLDVYIQTVKIIKRLINTEAFRNIGAKLIDTKFPGCERFDQETDDYWKCFVKQFTYSVWHYSCTCKMGYGEDDKSAVLDSKLRVLGTTGLRVIDNSIMPMITNANTNAPAIVIGERGADIILEHWTSKSA